MKIKRMSLGDGEKKPSVSVRMNEFIESCPNIIVDPGINWCHLHQVTEEQLSVLKGLFKEGGIQFTAYQPEWGLQEYPSIIIRLRRWFQRPELGPGRKEKAKLISVIHRWKETGEFTGIDPSAYDELLARLESLPDKDDIYGYTLRFHY